MEFEFVNPRETPFVEPRSRGELPHLYKDGGSYFVTFRLFDAVVENKSHNRACKALLDTSESVKKDVVDDVAQVCERSEPPLQRGSCVLKNAEVANVIADCLCHFDRERYRLAAWCVMPNHVHAVLTPCANYSLTYILRSWKSYTAHRINRLLARAGPFWERESFDHLIRSLEHFEHFVRYVENNPVAAGLCAHPEEWPHSSASRRK